jgi:hypothetical protein
MSHSPLASRRVGRAPGRASGPVVLVWLLFAIAAASFWVRCEFVWEWASLLHEWNFGPLVHDRQWIIGAGDWREPFWSTFSISKFDMLRPAQSDDVPGTSFLYWHSAPTPYDPSSDPPTRTYFRLAGFWLTYDEDIISRPLLIKRKTALSVPYWAVEALCLLMIARYLGRARTLYRRKRNGRCLACGYDLRASPDRCPECGCERAPAPEPKKSGYAERNA